jgi:hypothetical protein
MGSSPAPEIKVKITGEDTGVSAAIKELSAQLQQLKRTQDGAGGSARKLGEAEAGAGRSMREAREGARLLSEETGVHLSRGLTGIIARSSTLGPLLNAAFPVAAAIGFGEVIASAAEKFSSLIANTFIYTDAMKAAYAVQLAVNADFVKRADENKKLDEEAALFGLKGSEREIAQIRKKGDEIKKVQDLVTAFENQRGAARLGLPNAAGNATTFTDTDQAGLGNAQGKLETLQKEQSALENSAMASKAEEDKTAADKAKTLKDQIDKARLAQIEAGFGNELELFKAQHAKEDQDNEANYQKGLESTASYYDRKRELALSASQKEIDALTAERDRVLAAPTKDQAGAIEQQTKAADLASKIAIAKVNQAKVDQQLQNEGAQKQDEENKKALDWQAKIAQAQGQRFNEASEKIEAEALQMAAELKKAGIAPDQVDAMVSKFKAASTQQAQFTGMKQGGQDATASLAAEEEDIRLKNIAIVAEAKIAELERSRIPVLQAMAAQMRAAAVGPEQIKEADDFAKSVDKIAVAAKNSTVSMQGFENSASQAIQGDLSTFLGSTIDKAHGVGDAFRQLADSVVGSIQKIVAQLVIQIAFQKLAQAAAAGGGGIGGLASSLHLAGGGLVVGPGSGTSDSIPARLSTGEFVMRASSVRDIGVDTLAKWNRGLNVPSIRGMSIPRFAEGGLVQTGTRSDGVDVNIGLDLEPGLILKHLSSKKAGKIVLTHVGNNPKAVSKALTRGQ